MPKQVISTRNAPAAVGASMKRLVLLSALLLLLVFFAMPAAAQDRLPAPELDILSAVNRSREGAGKGWDLGIQWKMVPGAVNYVVRIADSEGKTPKYVGDTTSRKKSNWKSALVSACCALWFRNLDEEQTIRIRLRALHGNNNKYGEKSAAFKLRLPGFDQAAVVP